MVQMTLLLLSSAIIALASFRPDVRIDHQNLSDHMCYQCAIAIGPDAPSGQPVYVVFEDDSMRGPSVIRADIMFQRSTDAGRTWLPTDLLIRRGAPYVYNPDITTDSDGNVYIVYVNMHRDTAGAYDRQILCTRSSDGGATWSAPARIDDDSVRLAGSISIAADSAGNLFCAWNDWRTGSSHIWSSVSADRGATWSRNVQVDDDTTDYDCAHADVFVQPGSNHYLVAAKAPRWFENRPHIRSCAFLYRSTDRGQTFEPGVQLDTFNRLAADPHVVADRDHIVCNYTGEGWTVRDTIITEARTFYTQADSWGSPVPVTNLDSLHELYYSGTLALSGDGHVHTALMVHDTAIGRDIYYTSSSNHGVSWSDIELVNDDVAVNSWYPDIGADITGHVYIVWEENDGDRQTIWFSTNNPAGIVGEPMRQPVGSKPLATVISNVLVLGAVDSRQNTEYRAELLSIAGRKVMDLEPGANDVRALAPGVYFVLEEPQASSHKPQAIRKVVVTR